MKQEVIGLNKCDALQPEEILEKVEALKNVSGKAVYAISAVALQGMQETLGALLKYIDKKED